MVNLLKFLYDERNVGAAHSFTFLSTLAVAKTKACPSPTGEIIEKKKKEEEGFITIKTQPSSMNSTYLQQKKKTQLYLRILISNKT